MSTNPCCPCDEAQANEAAREQGLPHDTPFLPSNDDGKTLCSFCWMPVRVSA